MTMAEYLSMGGYGVYVWPSYGLFAAGLAVLLITPYHRRRRLLRDLRRDAEAGR